MALLREFVIYLDNGAQKVVEAPSLRTALRQAEKGIGQAEILAAIARECLPQPTVEGMPFFAIFLKSPGFVPPEE